MVDDSPDMQRYLQLLLQLDGYHAVLAANSEEALRYLRQNSAVSVMLLDVQMPGLNGIETLRIVRQIRPDLKIIMCSGVDNPDTIREAISLGAQAYLVKPIQHLYLSAAVERCLVSEMFGPAPDHRVVAWPVPQPSRPN